MYSVQSGGVAERKASQKSGRKRCVRARDRCRSRSRSPGYARRISPPSTDRPGHESEMRTFTAREKGAVKDKRQALAVRTPRTTGTPVPGGRREGADEVGGVERGMEIGGSRPRSH